MEYDSLSRCLGGEMVDTRDSKSRAKERGGSSPRIESVYQYRFDPSSWNWNKFGSGSRNLGDLLYLMNGESALKSSALHPPPEYMLQQESHKGRLETSGKMPARNPADKVHYIVQGLATYPFSDFGTGRSQNGDYRVNSI